MTHQIDTDDPARLERAMHARYAACRVRGEWFALTDTAVSEVKAVSAVRYRTAGALPFGRAMRQIRNQSGQTVGQVATATGIRIGHLEAIEAGLCSPEWAIAASLADHFGVSLDAFRGPGDNEIPPMWKNFVESC